MQHVIHSLQIYQVKGDIHSNTYRKFLLFLITRFSKYICNQVPGKETATFIYLDYNSEMCLFCKISNDCVKISLLFCLLLLDLSLHATNEGEHSLVGIICFPFTIIPTVCNLERIYILLHLLLFIARFTVTAKQIFPFFLLSILFSFFLFFLLTIGYSIFLPFVRFLWSSITIWLFSIGQDPYLFCSCQQKGALLTEGTTVTLKLFFN